MRYYCWTCKKSVTSELPEDSVLRAVAICPECIEERKVTFPEDQKDNPLQHELLDLITLMPDSQTQEIIDYIMDLRRIRKMHDDDSNS